MSTQRKQLGPAIITGAAGGMGSAAAALLAADGWPLILCDRDAQRLEQVAAPLRASAARLDILAGDIADAKFPEHLIAAVAGRQIGAVIHTAGLSPTMGSAAEIFTVNYDATARLVEAIRPRMAEGACAVLIASCSGYMMKSPEIEAALDAIAPGGDSSGLRKFADSSGPAYSISKRGVIRMAERQAALFGAERKARIVSLSPGLIDTAMGRAEERVSPQMDMMLKKTPLGRRGIAEEIASVAVFLCSPGASYVSGCDIQVDGGVIAALRG
jgi:NAD(P)-dependent dehydrogenase (short-subunit alcohol dehydrogenase family)